MRKGARTAPKSYQNREIFLCLAHDAALHAPWELDQQSDYRYKEELFHLHRCAETVTARDAIKAVSTIWERLREARKCTHRRCSKDQRRTKLGGRGNESKHIEGCMEFRVIGNLAQTKLLPESNCTIQHQDTELFCFSSSPQASCGHMFVSMTSSQDVVHIFSKSGLL